MARYQGKKRLAFLKLLNTGCYQKHHNPTLTCAQSKSGALALWRGRGANPLGRYCA